MSISNDIRIKGAQKIEYEHKFLQKKVLLEQSIHDKFTALNQQFTRVIQDEAHDLVKLKVRLAGLEKISENRNQTLLEQEVLIRQYQTKLIKPIQKRVIVEKVDNELEFKYEIQEELVSKLRLKIQKLIGVLVCLKLYQPEYGLRIQQDDFDPNYLFMPKLPNYENILQSMQEKNDSQQQLIREQVINKN